MMRYHSTGIKNQFLFDGTRGRFACTPLCIQALYHLHDSLVHDGKLLEPKEWHRVMERGIRIWELWREKHPKLEPAFPTVQEIITMPECQGFYKLFSKESEECAGLILNNREIENIEGPLDRFVVRLAKQNRTSCAVIQVPIHASIALLSYGHSLFLFDPHGKKGSSECLLVQFTNVKEVVPFIIEKYQLDKMQSVNKMAALYSEEELQNLYCYSATLFTVK